MSALRAIRLLVFGETWLLPVGVVLLLVAGAALRTAGPHLWHDTGGLLLVGGVIALLTTSVARGSGHLPTGLDEGDGAHGRDSSPKRPAKSSPAGSSSAGR